MRRRLFSWTFLCLLCTGAAFIFAADTWQDDFTGGTPESTEVINDSVQPAKNSNWWEPAENWWNPAENWWDTGWQYRRSISINNTSGSALSDYQIKIENPVYDETGLVGSWHLDEPVGTISGTAVDSSGNFNDCVLSGFSAPNGIVAGGKYGNAMSFDGTDDSLSIADTASLSPTKLTVELWANPNSMSNWHFFVSKGSDSSGKMSYHVSYDNGIIKACITTNGTYTGANVTTPITNGVWSHIVFTYDGSVQALFLNGELKNSRSDVTGNIYDSDQEFAIGRKSFNNIEFFSGLMDEVRIYNRAISVNEIVAHYEAKAKLNYDDIRFVGNSGTELPYWKEKDGTFWTKVAGTGSIPDGLSTIYVYYGNTQAVHDNSQGGIQTFDFFDEFDGVLDSTKWNQDSGTWTVGTLGGRTCITIEPNADNMYLRAKNTSFASNYVVDWAFYTTQAGDAAAHPGITFYATSGYNDQFYFRPHQTGASGNTVKAYFNGGLITADQGNSNVNWNTWYNAKMILNGDTVNLFVNGATYNLSGFQYDGTYGNIGLTAHADGKNYFDYIRVRKYASPEPTYAIGSEITQTSSWQYRKAITINNAGAALSDYQVNITNPVYDESGLAGSWHFDEGTGTTAFDTSGNYNDGTLTNGPAWTPNGKTGNALSFNGTTNYVNLGNLSSMSTTTFTLTAWIKTSDANGGKIITKASDTNPSNQAFDMDVSNPEGKLFFFMENTGTGTPDDWYMRGTRTINDGTWHYVVATFNNGAPNFYVDGTPEIPGFITSAAPETSVTSFTWPVCVGGRGSEIFASNYFSGIIDEVQIYNRALSAGEIYARYQAKVKLNYGDIRFVNSAGTEELPYWTEKDGTFWTKVAGTNSIPSGLSTIYAYYGNTNAVSNNNGFAVFDAFDDFNDGNYDGWTVDSGTWSASNKYAEGTSGSTNNFLRPANFIPPVNYIAEYLYYTGNTADGGIAFRYQDSNNTYAEINRNPPNDINMFQKTGGGWSQKSFSSYAWPDNTWVKIKTTILNFTFSTEARDLSGKFLCSNSWTDPSSTWATGNFALYDYNTSDGRHDNIFVRKYASSDPVVSTGSEAVSTSAWQYRKPLTITNNSASAALPEGYTVTSGLGLTSLVSSSKAQPSGNDVAIVYKEPSSGKQYELDRNLEPGKSVFFDGTDDYVSAPDSTSFSFTGEITVSVWICPYRMNYSAQQSITSKGGGWNRAGWLITQETNNTIKWHLGSGSAEQSLITTTKVLPNTWNHIVGLWKSGTMYVYINGVQDTVTSVWANGYYSNAYTHYLGRTDGGATLYYNGLVDETCVFKRALTAPEITELYNSGTPKPLPLTSVGSDVNLISYYPFDGDFGDQSGKDNNCTAVNGAYLMDGKILSIPDLKQGMYFDGSNDYVSVGSNTSFDFGTGDFTLAAWVNLSANNAYGEAIIGKLDSSDNYGWCFTVVGPSSPPAGATGTLNMFPVSGQNWIGPSTGTVPIGSWTHVAAVRSSGVVTYYINGSPSGTANYASTYTRSKNLSLGYLYDGPSSDWYLNGRLDDVAIYTRSLSQAEIDSLYNSGTGRRAADVSTANLIAYWDLDGTFMDKSGNNNHGRAANVNGPFFTSGKITVPGTNALRFKLPASIAASTTNSSDYFLYYGNSSATDPADNPKNVYWFYDDFNDGVNSAWTSIAGTWSENGGYMKQTAAGDALMTINSLTGVSSAVFEADLIPQNSERDVHITLYSNLSNYYIHGIGGWARRTQLGKISGTSGNLAYVGSETDPVLGLPCHAKVIFDIPLHYIWMTGGGYYDYLNASDSSISSGTLGLRAYNSEWFDNVKVYKYIASEPAVSAATEITRYFTSGSFTSAFKDTISDNTTIDSVSWTQNGAGTISMEIRASNLATSGWGAESDPAWVNVSVNGNPPDDPVSGRFVQYRAAFIGTDGLNSEPALTQVGVTYTVHIIPPDDSVTSAELTNTWYSTADFTFTNNTGFGLDIQKYYYAWDNASTFTFTMTEPQWSAGTLGLDAASEGNWYLHYLPVSSTNDAGTSWNLGPYKFDPTAPATPALTAPVSNASISETTASFSWDAVSDLSGVTYIFQMDHYSSFGSPLISKTGLTDTAYGLTGEGDEILIGNSAYYWRVIAVDGAGNGTASSSRKFTTTSVVPQVTNSTTGESYPTLQAAIDSATTINGDVIEIKDSLTHTENIVITKNVVLENGTLAAATPDGFAVTGQGSSGGEILRNCVITSGGISNLALGENLTVYDPTSAVVTIQNSKLVNCLIESGTVIINSELENCYTGATPDYFVDAAGGDFHLSNTAADAIDSGKNLSAEFNNDKDNVARGMDIWEMPNFDSGAWDMGAYEFLITGGYINPPQAPSVPQVYFPADGTENLGTGVVLVWYPSTGSTPLEYEVHVSTSADMSGSYYDAAGITDTFAEITGLPYDSVFYWQVKASNDAGESAWSGVNAFSTQPAGGAETSTGTPSVPQLSYPEDDAGNLGENIIFVWYPSTGAAPLTYTLELALSEDMSLVLYEIDGIENTFRQVNGLPYNTSFYWRVKAVNDAGESEWSGIRQFVTSTESTISSGIPEKPVLSSPNNNVTVPDSSVTFQWYPSAGPGSITYDFQASTKADFSILAASYINITGVELEVSSVFDYNMNYYWRVRAHNENGYSAWSDARVFAKSQGVYSPVQSPVYNTTPSVSEGSVREKGGCFIKMLGPRRKRNP